MKKALRYSLLLFFQLTITGVFGSHIPGGNITYTCIGNSQYVVTLRLFENCSTGTGFSNTLAIKLSNSCTSGQQSINLPKISGPTEISQLCPAAKPSSYCNGTGTALGAYPGIEETVYQDTITIPYACNFWTFSYYNCCRNTAANSSSATSAGIYFATTLNNVADSCNNSPYLNAPPVPYFCVNQPATFNPAAVDVDGDSIAYELVAALIDNNGTTPLTYNAGYSGTNPVDAMTFNPVTGQLNFTPATIGSYIVVYKIKEYDAYGNLLSTNIFDFRAEVISCTNQMPTAGSMTSFTGTAVNPGPGMIEGCPGDNFCFSMSFNDPNPLDSLYLTSNVTSVIPGATFTVSGLFSNSKTVTICGSIPTTGAASSYNFVINGEDNACPVKGIVTYPVLVTVLSGTYAGPDVTICNGQSAQLSAMGGSSFTWSGPNLSCTTCPNPTVTPSVTSQYILTSNMSANCIYTDTVQVNVVTNYTLSATPLVDTICFGEQSQLNASVNPTGSYSYLWTPYAGLNSDTIPNPLASPTSTTTYVVTSTSSQGCVKSDSVLIVVSGVGPTVELTPDTNICLGQTVPVSSTVVLQPGYCGLNYTGCTGTSDTATFGNGTNASGLYGPFYGSTSPLNRYKLKHQYIIGADELQAAGYSFGGTITHIALNLSTVNNQLIENFKISMGCTSLDQFPNGVFETNVNQVYAVNSWSPPAATGWVTFQLQTAYDWDGTSNIVVEFCSDGSALPNENKVHYTSTTPKYRAIYDYDVAGGCGITSGYRTYSRPNMKLTVCQRSLTNPVYTWTPATGLSSTNTPNTNASPTTSTTYTLTVMDGSGCSGTGQIDIGVGPDYNVVTTPDTGLCYGNTINISSVPDQPGSYTYDWTPSLGLSNDSIQNPNASPPGSNMYYVTVSNGNCVKYDSLQIDVFGNPITATVSKDTVCPGEQVQLEVSALPVSCGINYGGCNGSSVVSTVGNGTYSSSSYSPFYGSYSDFKVQYLYKASDLVAAGLTAGVISEIAWNVLYKYSSGSFDNFTIKMGCTNATYLSASNGWEPTAGVVYGPVSYTSAIGWNTIPLTNGFEWDGSSNIVVEVCFDNAGSVSYDNVEYSSGVGYNATMRNYQNGASGCTLSPQYAYSAYPNVKFKVCTPTMPASASILWTPATGLNDPTITNPTATVNGNYTYTVSVSDPSLPGCSSTASVGVWIDSTNYVTATPDTTLCSADTIQLNATYYGPPPISSIPCGANSTACSSPSQTGTVGTATTSNTSTGYPAVYGNYYWGAKHQMLYTPADLAAAGITSGTLSEIAFFVSSINSVPTLENVTIKVGCTSQSSLSGWFTGLTQVYSAATYTVVSGWNAHQLQQTYDWDGVSNLVVEFCFNNSSYVSGGNASTQYTVTSSNTVLYRYADNATVCSSSPTPYQSNKRFNTRFKACPAPPASLSYAWTPGATLSDSTIINPLATPSATTNYVVTVSGGKCIVSDTVAVNFNNIAPTVSPAGPINICPGDSVVLTTNLLAGFSWSTGDTTQSIVVKNAGNYSVTDMVCGGVSNQVAVSTTNPTQVYINTTTGDSTFCTGDSLQLISSLPSNNLWSNGSTAPSIYATATGQYWLQNTDSSGCITSDSINVVETPAQTPTITAGGPLSFCQGDSVQLTSSFGTNILWSNGETTASIYAKNTGNYTVTYNGSCGGTSAPVSVTVHSNPVPVIVAGGPTTFCQGDSVSLTSADASGNLWSNGDTLQSIYASTSGMYTLQVTDANGCSGEDSVQVTVNPSTTPVITANGPITFCQGDNVILSANTSGPVIWNTGDTTQSITVTSGGSYTVTANNACGGTSAAENVTVNPNPSVTISANGPVTFCQGDSVVLTSSESTGNAWNTGDTIQSVAASTGGIYSVTASNSFGCTDQDSITVTVNPSTSPVVTANGPTTFCQGDSVILTSNISFPVSWNTGDTTQSITVNSIGNYFVTDNSGCGGSSAPISVTVNSNPVVSVTAGGPTTFCQGDSVILTSNQSPGNSWSTGQVTQSITALTTDIYVVQVTDTNGCFGADSMQVTVNPTFTPTITATGSTTFCQGDSVILTSSIASPVSWNTGDTTQSITVNSAGSYTVTDNSGCGGTSAPETVTVHSNPTVSVTASGPTSICQGDSVQLVSNQPSGNIWNTGAVTQSIYASAAGIFTVNVTDANGCEGSDSIQVSVTPINTPTITAGGSTTFCQGDSVILTSNIPGSQTWSSGDTTQSIVVTVSGSYTVTDNSTCGGTSSPEAVTVSQYPQAQINVSGPTTFCQGDSVILVSNDPNGNSWNTGSGNQSVTVSSAGTYILTVTNSAGCADSDTVQVTVNPSTTPTVTAGSSTTFCQGDSVVLSSNIPGSQTWSTGDTTQFITVLASGSYSVTDNSSCGGTSTPVTVTVWSNPVPVITASPSATFCQGDSVQLTSSEVNGNAWSTGSGNPSITVYNSGTYVLQNTNGGGCTRFDSIQVTVNPVVTPVIMASGPTTFCQGDSVLLSASTAGPFTWSNGAVTDSIYVSTSGSYTVSDNSTCGTTSSPVSVTVNPANTPVVTVTGSTTFCQGGSVTLTSNVTSGITWSNGDTTTTINVSSSGSYTVTYNSGCGGTSAPVQVTVNPLPAPTITAGGPLTFCDGGQVVLSSNYQAGNTWSDPSSTTLPDLIVTTSGTYEVSVTDTNGCTNTSTPVTVTVNPNPQVSFGSVSPVCISASPFSLTAGIPSGGYYAGGGVSFNTFDPSQAGLGTHVIQYSYTDGNGCSDSATFNIEVEPQATASILSAGPLCEQDPDSQLVATGGPGYWSGAGISDTATGVFSPALAGTGTHQIIYTIPGACGDKDTLMLTVNANPSIVVSPDVTIEYGSSTSLTALGTNNYLWTPPSGLSCTDCQSTEATPSVTTTYTVTTTNSVGCSASGVVTVTVEVPDGELFVPNMFSPNNDGKNDKVFVYGNNISKMDFRIFNRWGQLVYETQSQSNGWDGTQGGVPLDPAVFVYYLKVVYESGREEQLHGNITLVK